MSLDEKLAVEVMGWEMKDDHPEGRCWAKNGRYTEFPFRWRPIQDLNQLKMCYEAAEKAFNTQTPHFTFAGTVFAHLKALLRESITRVNDVVMPYEMMSAWVKHPELVAQAILKAKGVS